MAAAGRKSVIVDYEDLIHYNTDLAESMLKDPDRALKECKAAAFEVQHGESRVRGRDKEEPHGPPPGRHRQGQPEEGRHLPP